MSFKKRNVDQQVKLPSGSRLSAYNGQLLISTGVPSLDDILGGGQPVGTVMLIKEDKTTNYAHLLLKYFIAQGIASDNHCIVTSKEEDPEAILRSLMWVSGSDKEEEETTTQPDNDRMKIAWRYSHLKRFETGVKSKPVTPPVNNKPDSVTEDIKPYCSQFDLTKKIPIPVLEEADISIIQSDESDNDYEALFNEIRSVVLNNHFSSIVPAPAGITRKALRIAIHSLASPSWQSKTPHDLYKFFHALRGLLRFSFGTAIITLPAYLYDDPHVIRRIEHIVDAVIEIESFAGDPIHSEASYTQNYHGFFHVHKVPVLNSLLPSSTKLSILSGGGHNDLGFKLRRKRFSIETFHLPPEGGVVTRRTEVKQEEEKSKETTSKMTNKLANRVQCGSSGQSKLEF
ncbi:Elongator complex protein 4 [Pilobolus umbonatus]|nr:Elongator complex protein 4 [Pilobolus umbonatus]